MTPMITTSTLRKSTTIRNALTAAFLFGALTFPISQAAAVSPAVKMACLSDYLSYCSSHAPDTPQLRRCMSTAGPKLSTRCVNALIAAGEVSKAEVNRRKAADRRNLAAR